MKSLKLSPKTNCVLWDDNAEGWHGHVGEHGDRNRRFNSDPVLWRLLGNVDGETVLDAGCGTGYLARKLAAAGARVLAVDYSVKMVHLARDLSTPSGAQVDYRVDSCATLASVEDGSCDKLVSNYVLQDLPELADAVGAFHRVLRPGGKAVLVFSHPCFPQSDETLVQPDGSVTYRWPFSYFEEHELEDPPWGTLSAPIVFYHRPLSAYWRAFRKARFEVMDFDEPVVAAEPPEGYDLTRLQSARMRPLSVAFLLRKPL